MYQVGTTIDSGPRAACANASAGWASPCAESSADGGSRSNATCLCLAALLPANIGWQCLPGLGSSEATRASALRRSQQQFLRGRQAAYAALLSVGFVDERAGQATNLQVKRAELDRSADCTASYLTSVVGKNADRSPRWPVGFVGSISHSRNWVMAVAARAKDYASIGIDSEPIATEEQASLLKLDIGRAAEWQLLESIGMSLPTAFTLLFSAKEAFYKCWYPLKQRYLDFPEVSARRIELEQAFSSDRTAAGTIALAASGSDGMELPVRFSITSQDVYTIAIVSNGMLSNLP